MRIEHKVFLITLVVILVPMLILAGILIYLNFFVIKSQQDKIAQLKIQIRELVKKREQISVLQQDIKKLLIQYERSSARVPPASETSLVDSLKMIEAIAKRSNVEITGLTRSRISPARGATGQEKIIPANIDANVYEFVLDGKFIALWNFLKNIETDSRYYYIQDFSISGNVKGARTQDPTMRSMKLTLHFYTQKSSPGLK